MPRTVPTQMARLGRLSSPHSTKGLFSGLLGVSAASARELVTSSSLSSWSKAMVSRSGLHVGGQSGREILGQAFRSL